MNLPHLRWACTKEFIEAGGTLPKGYRIAYWDVTRNWAVAYPIGLHLIVRGFHAAHMWTFRWRPNKWDRLLRTHREQGYSVGYGAGIDYAMRAKLIRGKQGPRKTAANRAERRRRVKAGGKRKADTDSAPR